MGKTKRTDFEMTLTYGEAAVEMRHPDLRDKAFIVKNEAGVFLSYENPPLPLPESLTEAIQALASVIKRCHPTENILSWGTEDPKSLWAWRGWLQGRWLEFPLQEADQRAIAEAASRVTQEVARFLAEVGP
jgi:hypothetical protein